MTSFMIFKSVDESAYTKGLDEYLTCDYVEPSTEPEQESHDKNTTTSDSTASGNSGV